MKRRLIIQTTAAALMCITLGVPHAAAQTQDGRALDNNLMVGGGGVNPATPQNFAAGNALVTGNVAGNAYFRGDVGYTAPGEFAGQLGGDSTFRFRAESLPQGLTGFSPQGASGLQVYRDASTPGIGTVNAIGVTRTPPSLFSPIAPSATGLRVYQQPDGALSSDITDSAMGLTGSPIGYVRGEGGQMMRMAASPLRGVHTQALDAAGQALGVRQQADLDPYLSQFQQAGQLPDEGDAPSTLSDTRTDMRALSDVQSRIDAGPSAGLDQRIDTITRRPAGAEGSRQVRPGTDVYGDLLAQIRAQQEQAAGQDAAAMQEQTRIAPLGQPTQEAEAEAGTASGRESQGSAAPGPVTFEGAKLRRPSLEDMLDADRQRREAQRQAAGLATEEAPAADAGQKDRSRGIEYDDEGNPVAPTPQFKGMVYDLPPVPSLAKADRADRVGQWMREAEQFIADGNYFRALDRYQQALAFEPDNPMIQVGRLHAQLGAGMLRSAAMTAHRLFDDHPELIAARYESRLLPGIDRLEAIHSQLDEMIEATDGRSADAGLLLAYMGYQTGTAELTRYGLDVAVAGDPEDPLLPVLRAVWLRGENEPIDSSGVEDQGQQEPDPQGQPAAEAAPAKSPAAIDAEAADTTDVVEIQANPRQPQAPAGQAGQQEDQSPEPVIDLDALDAALDADLDAGAEPEK